MTIEIIFMINLHESMGLGQDRTRDPRICSQTRNYCQTCYRLRYAARFLVYASRFNQTLSVFEAVGTLLLWQNLIISEASGEFEFRKNNIKTPCGLSCEHSRRGTILILLYLSCDMGFPTMLHVRPAKPQINLRVAYAQSD